MLCLLAPVYSHDIAHIGPNGENITGTIKVGGKLEDIVSSTGIPIGPTWHSHYFFGADGNGRDIAVRLLYGGRNSLEIGAVATLITMVLGADPRASSPATSAASSTRSSAVVLDVIWAYPAVLLGITLGTVLAVGGIGPLKGTTLLVPAVVIGFVYIPYVAKPVRGQVLTLREREFVDAARQQGLSNWRIMFSRDPAQPGLDDHRLHPADPGQRDPARGGAVVPGRRRAAAEPVVGHDDLRRRRTRSRPPSTNVLVPGIMLVLTVMSINIFGDGLRDALDPRAKVRIAH